ncbi:MAG: TrkA family potassium uptake protein [Bacteroidales bacterium]|nr:TrkA family potassium uptake protein [Bacteroidales bacterium]
MRYLIIGLGIYGTNLAKDLTDLGHEVIGADIKGSKVDSIKDYIATAYIIDSTEEAAIGVLPLKNVDLVIVTIGENFGASIKTVALLRKIGVRKIYARAIDELHKAILEGLKVDRILNPEQRAAYDLVNEMALGNEVETLTIDDENMVMRFAAPEYFHGMNYSALTPQNMFGLKLIAASRQHTVTNLLGIKSSSMQSILLDSDENETVKNGDQFTCIGTGKDYKSLFRHISRL